MSCGNCGADRIVVHAVLRCTSEFRYTCPCCKEQICLTCKEDVGEPSDTLCDSCWVEKNDPDDEASEGFRLLVELAFRTMQDRKD
jgi:hypothetical protein